MVAASAALVRQFFREGFHVAGSQNLARGFTPPAALVKAVLIHSSEKIVDLKAPEGEKVRAGRGAGGACGL